MKLLISNDDGILAPGIQILSETMRQVGEVVTVAPDRNRSGSSASLTLDRPLNIKKIAENSYSVSGTPCDCVHVGSHKLMTQKPDMVIAGINRGPNLGDDVIYSGTVAAAMEGRSLGFPAIAVSLASEKCENYQSAADVMLRLVNRLKIESLNPQIILNVNVPDLPIKEIAGFRITRLGSRHRSDTIVPAKNPRGKEIYWLGPPSEPQDIGSETDFSAVADGYVSITPLVVDLTAHSELPEVEQWLLDGGL